MMKHVPPAITKTSFNCPHCGALAHQDWYSLLADKSREPPGGLISAEMRVLFGGGRHEDGPFLGSPPKSMFPEGNEARSSENFKNLYHMFVSQCFSCKAISIWADDKLVYPQRGGEAPPANPDLSDDIRRDYDEASRILDLSPRGAAALLRLALQKLCKELGQPGKNINDDIKALVADGLDPVVQQALDSIRVHGNKAVHPGDIDLREEPGTAEVLFGVLNLIVDKMISSPKRVEELYKALPEKELQRIEKRDGRT